MTDPAQTVDPQEPGTVIGYRRHTQAEVDLVNENKQLENLVGDQVTKVRGADVDQRWVAIARTHFQEGFMALNRAVFQPESRL